MLGLLLGLLGAVFIDGAEDVHVSGCTFDQVRLTPWHNL